MKSILFFDNSLDGRVGGSHHSLLLMVKNLDGAKYEKVVVLNSDNALRPEFERHCRNVIVWDGPSAASFEGLGNKRDWMSKFSFRPPFVSRLLNLCLKILAVILNDVLSGALITFRYIALLKREKISIVHLNNWFDPYWIIAAKLTRIPIIQHTRGIACSFYSPFCHWVDKVICISADVRKRLVEKGIDRDKTALVYNAIDTKEFCHKMDPRAIRSELGINGSQPVIAIFGNIQRWKGQETVIRACEILKKKYPSLKCLLVGEVIEEKYLSELRELVQSKEMDANVQFVNYRSDVADCMNAADIIVHASISPEPFGRVIIEAMTIGKPVVAANAGAVPEIVEDRVSGLLFEPGNDDELAHKIETILQHPEDALQLGKHASERVRKRFNIERQISLIEEFYESVL